MKIQVLEDGPLLVTGAAELVDHQGNSIQPPKAGVMALCRCGGSTTKPFCDGTHSKIGFRGACEAVAETAQAEGI